MKNFLTTTALFGVVATFACPAYAQQVGQACTTVSTNTPTQQSIIPTEGIIECIPDINGNYFWQPMGAGIARYDITVACNVAGALRWNGSAIQVCNGSGWQSIGSGNGKLYWDGSWRSDNYWCDAGFHIVMFHYDCGCSNNTTWFECQAN
jgi:hypothetical protein